MVKNLLIFLYSIGLSISSNGQSYLCNYQISWSGDYIVGESDGTINKYFNSNFKSDLTDIYQFTYNSISNGNGNLILYTDGYRVFNSKGALLEGSLKADSFQRLPYCIIVPIPKSNDRYLIITSLFFKRKFYIQEVLLNPETGIGKVIKMDSINNLVPFNLGLYQHCDPEKKWLILYEQNSYNALAYEISGNGINSVPVISKFYDLPNVEKANLIFSPDSKKILINFEIKAIPVKISKWYIINFDQKTGKFFNPEKIMEINNNDNKLIQSYRPCFSPKGEFIYYKTIVLTQPNTSTGYSEITRYHVKKKTFEVVYQSQVGMVLDESNVYSISPNSLTYLAGNSWFKVTKGNYYLIENGRYFGVFEADNPDVKKVVLKDYLSKPDSVLIPLNFGSPVFNYRPFVDNDLIVSKACSGLNSTFKINTTIDINEIKCDFGDGIVTKGLSTSIQHIYRDTGVFHIKAIIYSCGRVDTLITAVNIKQAPELSNLKDTAICVGSAITFTIKGDGKIRWNTGDTLPSITTSSEGLYKVFVSNVCGNFDKQGSLTLLNPYSILPEKELVLCSEQLNLAANQASQIYLWNNLEATREIWVNKAGKYWVDLNNGCFSGKEEFIVRENDKQGNINFPNAITVNGDGLNDSWIPISINIESLEFKVYNRWGELVFESLNGQKKWNPDANAQGVYFYVCNYKEFCSDPKLAKGNITLLK